MLHGEDVGTARRLTVARHLALLPQHVDDIFPATVLDTAMIGRHPHVGRWQWETSRDLAIGRAALAAVAEAAGALIVLIGPNWLVHNEYGLPRLHEPGDQVADEMGHPGRIGHCGTLLLRLFPLRIVLPLLVIQQYALQKIEGHPTY